MLPAALATTAALTGGMSWAVRGRASTVFGPSVWHAPHPHPSIALTFDDGPGPQTPALLEILAAHRVPATFFQVGANVRRSPALAREVLAAGHEIGNHSDTHPNCALKPASFIRDDFTRAQNTIAATTGRAPVLLRAPYGVRWFGFASMQRELNLLGVMWTVIGFDWRLPAPAIEARVLRQTHEGGIICLHDGRGADPNPDRRATVEAVRRIIPALLERGYSFETVSQLLCPSPKPVTT